MSGGREEERTKPNIWLMFFYGYVAISSVHRLRGQESGWRLWVDILLLMLGVGGFAAAVLRPSVFERRKTGEETPLWEKIATAASVLLLVVVVLVITR